MLAGLVLAGLAPRVWRLDRPGLTSDEAFSWRLANYPVGEMLRRAAEDVHPPLYYLLLDAWLALFGDGPHALRGLSAALGLLVVPLTFLLVEEAARLEEAGRALRVRRGAWLAALLLALHANQVLQARNARMYALGTVLATGSAWLVLRAARAERARAAWWAAWGASVAAALLTHYYLLFTVAAQAGWALMAARQRGRRGVRDLMIAGAVALAAFAPWAPVFLRQARQVREDYWLAPPTPSSLADGLARWAAGIDVSPDALVALAVLLSLAAAARAGRAGRFFALQATAPWLLGLAVSAATGRPLVLERYMVFAQVFLVAAWAVAVALVESARARAALAGALVVAVGAGLGKTVAACPSQPPAMAAAARFLKRQAGGETVVVESPRALNKLRYYARQADAPGLEVRCALPERRPLPRHVSHVVSLAPGDVVSADAVFALDRSTLWTGRESTAPPDPAPPGWTITYARIFEGGGDTRFALVRYQRAPSAP